MQYECKFSLSSLAVALLRSDDPETEKQYDDAKQAQKNLFSCLFSGMTSGKIDCLFWRSGGNLYTLTRSAKHPDAIQRTCFWIRGGDLVPLSDQQYFTFDDFRRDYLPDGVTVYTF